MEIFQKNLDFLINKPQISKLSIRNSGLFALLFFLFEAYVIDAEHVSEVYHGKHGQRRQKIDEPYRIELNTVYGKREDPHVHSVKEESRRIGNAADILHKRAIGEKTCYSDKYGKKIQYRV